MNAQKQTALEEMNGRHARERAEMLRKEALMPLLPIAPAHLCAHSGKDRTMSASYEVAALPEAMDIYTAFLPLIVDCEAWRAGCLSVLPAAINRYKERPDTSIMEFLAHVEIKLHSYGDHAYYQDQKLSFYARIGEEWINVSIKIARAWQPVAWWQQGSKHEPGHLVKNLPSLGEDNRIGWWSPNDNYSRSYYWADTHNFVASMGHEIAQLAKKEGSK